MPDLEKLLEELWAAYVEVLRRYGGGEAVKLRYPAPCGGPVWGRYGVYDELKRRGVVSSWDEFRRFMEQLPPKGNVDKLGGKVWVNWVLAPNGKVEPHSISIWKSLK